MGVFAKVFSFGLGMYTGVYYCQNYDTCPKVDDPATIWKKFQVYLEEQTKDSKK